MNLFEPEFSRIINTDGEVDYYGPVFTSVAASAYLHSLLNQISWENDVAIMFGKRIITKRMVAWYGDRDFSYSYSKTTKYALSWTTELIALKALVEARSGLTYNSCLLNLYHDGNEGMGWHSDDERSLESGSSISSLSFGAPRNFSFKHKVSGETVNINLESGSLLVMKGATQHNWLHALPKTTKVKLPRINLTFRTMGLTEA